MEPTIQTIAHNYDWALTFILLLAYFTPQLTWWAAEFRHTLTRNIARTTSLPAENFFCGVKAGSNGDTQRM